MGFTPPRSVVNAIENGVTVVTSRVVAYEADGLTVWNPSPIDDPEFKRLVDGSISIDYSSDERRKADLTLMNNDNLLRINPRGGFYYDKILKIFRCIKYSPYLTVPPIALAEFDGTISEKINLTRIIAGLGYELVDMTDQDDRIMDGYFAVMFWNMNAVTTRVSFMKNVFQDGRNVITVGIKNGSAQMPWVGNSSAPVSNTYGYSPSGQDNPMAGSITSTNTTSTVVGTRITGITAYAQAVAVYPPTPSATDYTVTFATNSRGGQWMDFHLPTIDQPQLLAAFKRGVDYMRNEASSELTWEYQLGEFMIDGINDQIVGDQVKLTLRDYTKKLLNDKLTNASTFVAGTSLKTFITAIASNGGIKKFRVAVGTEVFPSDTSYDRGTSRWQMLKEVCTSFNYEIFFDNEGYLVVRKFLDPTTSPISHTLSTGRKGNLIDFQRSLSDSRIFNIVNVYGDPVDSSSPRLPYFGTARNDDPNSATSTVRIGNRVADPIISTFFESDEQCRALALSRLKILALESYEANFSSLYYPWLEVGEIIEIIDPNAVATDPTRYLMDSLAMPLGLGPMTGTGKRVTVVGNAGQPESFVADNRTAARYGV